MRRSSRRGRKAVVIGNLAGLFVLAVLLVSLIYGAVLVLHSLGILHA